VHSLTEKTNQSDKDKAKLQAVDYMDDGSKIFLSVEIDGKEVRSEKYFIYSTLFHLNTV
jgi:hypothetical protein